MSVFFLDVYMTLQNINVSAKVTFIPGKTLFLLEVSCCAVRPLSDGQGLLNFSSSLSDFFGERLFQFTASGFVFQTS